jgi:hypothetical protein
VRRQCRSFRYAVLDSLLSSSLGKEVWFDFRVEQLANASHVDMWQLYLDTSERSLGFEHA